jgi:hypothetical protein
MLSPRLTNCPECANIPSLIKKIDCKLAELGNNLYNNISYMLNKSVPSNDILQLIGYRRILMYKYYNPNYVHTYSVQMIASRVIRLTSGCVSKCNEPERCLEEPCDITIVPNPTTTTSTTIQPTTTTTSSSSTSTSTSTTTSTSSTTTTTTTTIASMCFYMGGETPGDLYSCTVEPEVGLINGKPYYKLLLPDCTTQWVGFDEPVYIWFSTSGDYVNQWVVSELYNATIGNVFSYISSGGSGSYPIGTWEVLADQIFVVDSSIGPCPTTTTTSSSSTSTSSTSTTSTSSTSTTSTSSTSSTTTTSTTLLFPSASPCVWSRDIDVVGSIDVYDIDSNTTVTISVPNDFATPTEITMQASTNNKLWIGDGANTIKEWDIMQETLSLSFVRDINVISFGSSQNQPNTIAAINDTTILLGNTTTSGGLANIGYWDITSPSVTISLGNSVASRSVGVTNTFGVNEEITGIVYTNSGNVIISTRNNFVSSTNNVGNFIKQYAGLPNPSFSIPWLPSIGAIRVQDTVDFTIGYTGRKAFDLFAWNGIVYLVNPETSDLYEVEQNSNYGLTLLESNLGYSDTQTFWASTGCSNVNFEVYAPDCTPTSLPGLRSSASGPYIGPVNFTYLGMTVQASSVIYQGTRPAAYANDIFSCSGLSVGNTPTVFTIGNTGSCSLDTPAFDYTLTFPSPVNNIPFRLAVVDGNDDFRFTTNGGTPTITANVSCYIDIVGNELYGVDGTFFGGGGGEFVITAPSDYTQVTISGTNCGNGGPIWLGCTDDPVVTTSTTTLFPPTTTTTTTIAGVNTVFTYFEGVTP